jgi:hypothetical protein
MNAAEVGSSLNPECAVTPVLGSARGLVKMQPGWDEPMNFDEMEKLFCVSDGASA